MPMRKWEAQLRPTGVRYLQDQERKQGGVTENAGQTTGRETSGLQQQATVGLGWPGQQD